MLFHRQIFTASALTAILSCYHAAALVFPAPSGPYQVAMTAQELVDPSRADPFNASHPRRMMISRFTPVPRRSCVQTCTVPYMTPLVASLEDELLSGYLPGGAWPSGLLADLQLELCCDFSGKAKGEEDWPVVLFASGYNTTRTFYSALAQQIASAGFEVVTMDHPYETDVVELPDGTAIYGGVVTSENLVLGLDARTADASLVLDSLAIAGAIYAGHSLGGAAAAHALSSPQPDGRIKGGVNLDGALQGPAPSLGVSRPFLQVGNPTHNWTTVDLDPSWKQFWEVMGANHTDVWLKELSVAGAVHNSFADFSLIADVAGLRKDPATLPLVGETTGERIAEILKGYVGDFARFTLQQGTGEGLLAGPSGKFPDVEFVRSYDD